MESKWDVPSNKMILMKTLSTGKDVCRIPEEAAYVETDLLKENTKTKNSYMDFDALSKN